MKILWAVDAFHTPSASLAAGWGFLQALRQKSEEKSEVVYLASRYENELYTAFDVPVERRFSLYPLEVLQKLFKKAKIPEQEFNLNVEGIDTLSLSKSVEQFDRVVERKGADLVLLFSSNKGRVKRLVLGSFAESVLYTSKRAVLVLPPQPTALKKLKKILVADDFSRPLAESLAPALKIAQDAGASLTLLHAASLRIKFPKPESQEYKDQLQSKMAEAQALASQAGVKFSPLINKSGGILSDIIAETSKKFDLVVLTPKASSWSVLMGGSVTRQVLRSTPKPLLLLPS